MKDFKVGDRVRIREWEDMEKELGVDGSGSIKCEYDFTLEMKHLCGCTATIENINKNKIELKDWSHTSCYIFCNFSADMIEKVEEEVNMNKMAEVAKLFGVELDEEFDIEGSGCNPHKFTLDGIEDRNGEPKECCLYALLIGKLKVIKRPWRPQRGERYWRVHADGNSADCVYFDADDTDYRFMKTGNCFKTREEAEANIARIKAEREAFFAYVK